MKKCLLAVLASLMMVSGLAAGLISTATPASADEAFVPTGCIATIRDGVQGLTNCDHTSASGTALVVVNADIPYGDQIKVKYHWGYGIICADAIFIHNSDGWVNEDHAGGYPGPTDLLNYQPNYCQAAGAYGVRSVGVRFFLVCGYEDTVALVTYGAVSAAGYVTNCA